MYFELVPILDIMLDFYEKPRDLERFQAYLSLLKGETKGDLARPIGGFNPMAKPQVLEKLTELKALDAEKIMAITLADLSDKQKNAPVFKVSLTVSDDFQGGWTNRYTTDFDSKFKLNPLIQRQFCTPIFWTSEDYSEDIIHERTLEYAFRTLYWFDKKTKPVTLKDHVEQEQFVAKKRTPQYMERNGIPKIGRSPKMPCDTHFLQKFYKTHADSDDYALIFNFFYGDAACETLGFKTFGIADEMAGFKFARNVQATSVA
jgi:hypothetical protein